ncbi:flippase activity-associated protein Agl23 [Verrucomicrobiota bacterium]
MKKSTAYGFCLLVIAFAALAFRLFDLGQRPMHHDEANQAVRTGLLLETGEYRYDPHEHHGPTLYYFSLPIIRLTAGSIFANTTEFSFRLLPVIFGVGLILLLYLVHDGLGRPATIATAVLTAVSSAMAYYNRFYIQETLLVFFTFGTIAAGWRYLKKPSAFRAIITGLFIGLMHATKETCVIAYGAIFLAMLGSRSQESGVRSQESKVVWHVAAALGTAVVVSVLFYSSFFTNWQGAIDSIKTYMIYLGRAGGDELTELPPWYYYLQILTFVKDSGGLIWSEAFILVLALAGFVTAWIPRSDQLPARGLHRFFALYTIIMILAYSVIPYKTPWSMLSLLHGLIILAGIGAVVLFKMLKTDKARILVGILLAAGVSHLIYQTCLANYKYPADKRNPYAYVQTSKDFLKLIQRIEDIADIHPRGRNMFIEVIAPTEDMWPLPWYLRKFTKVGYWTNTDDLPEGVEPAIIIASPDIKEIFYPETPSRYQMEYYELRPGRILALFVKNYLANAEENRKLPARPASPD